jgi:hypothetical protein
MAKSIASCKAKGRRLTQELCQALLEVSDALKFGLTPDDIRPVPSSVIGEDVWLSSRARQLFPFSFECKNQEKLNIWQSWKQCAGNAGKWFPALVFKRNREEAKVVLDLPTFCALLTVLALSADISHPLSDSKPESHPGSGYL